MPRTFGRASVYHLAFHTMMCPAFVFVARMNRRHLRMESKIGGGRGKTRDISAGGCLLAENQQRLEERKSTLMTMTWSAGTVD